MDFSALMKLKQAWDTFQQNHPNFPKFLNDVKSRGVQEGTEIAIDITYPNGQHVRSTIKVKPSDVALFNSLSGLMK
ncbi:MAG: hypothetical protein MJ129_03505 [Clostridia bacterium]|nr:hypothetical protein [Clostridia bacterium]